MSNLTISVDDRLIKLARVRAIQEGTSVSAKIREFLVQYARGDAPAIQPTDSGASYFRVFDGGCGMRPGVDPLSNRALEEAAEGAEEARARYNPAPGA